MDLAAAQNARLPTQSDMIGRVAAVTGAQATIELNARAGLGEMPTVGKFMGLMAPKGVIIGLITEIGEQTLTAGAGAAPNFRKMARLDLIGELRPGENGTTRFQRGVTEYPKIGDDAQLLPEAELRAVYGLANADRAHIGDLQQNPNIPIHITFFMMDENFLLHRARAMRLLDRMKEAGKSWALSVFSSANAIRKYTMEELVELGISWVWMGLESPRSSYAKLQGADTLSLTRELREHGIRVLGSTIVGLEHHTPDNLAQEIEYAVGHGTDFHQFMLYTPVPGTPLYQEMSEQGRMLEGIDLADVHGQFKFNFRHAAISRDDSKRFLDWAFWRDFERNGRRGRGRDAGRVLEAEAVRAGAGSDRRARRQGQEGGPLT